MQLPTTANYAAKFPTFGEIQGSAHWRAMDELSPGKPPCDHGVLPPVPSHPPACRPVPSPPPLPSPTPHPPTPARRVWSCWFLTTVSNIHTKDTCGGFVFNPFHCRIILITSIYC